MLNFNEALAIKQATRNGGRLVGMSALFKIRTAALTETLGTQSTLHKGMTPAIRAAVLAKLSGAQPPGAVDVESSPIVKAARASAVQDAEEKLQRALSGLPAEAKGAAAKILAGEDISGEAKAYLINGGYSHIEVLIRARIAAENKDAEAAHYRAWADSLETSKQAMAADLAKDRAAVAKAGGDSPLVRAAKAKALDMINTARAQGR